MTTVTDFILNSKPHEVSVVHQRLTAHLNYIVGPEGNRRNLDPDGCVKATEKVNRVLSAIENRLKKTPEIDLYQTHKIICQDYLNHLCSVMSPPSYAYLNSRCQLVACYEDLGKLEDAQREGLEVLNHISILVEGRPIPQGQVLPTYRRGCDFKIAETVIKMCMMLLAASWSSIKEDDLMLDFEEDTQNVDIYMYILSLADNMDPWIKHFRSLPNHDRIRQWLAEFFKDRTLSLVKKRLPSEIAWIENYCTMTLSNFVKASMDDGICNFGEEICHLIFSKSDDPFFSDSTILVCVLKFIAERCMIHPETNLNVDFFLKLAVHCTINRGPVTANNCNDLASFFHTSADWFSAMFPPPKVNSIHVHLVLKHLAVALVISDLDSYRCGDPNLSNRSSSQVSGDLEAHLDEWIGSIHNKYLKLDIFFYDRLATLVLSDESIGAHEDSIDPIRLPTNIPAVFQRFIDDFSTYCGSERNEFIENKHIQVAAKVVVAYFTLLLTTNDDMKKIDDAFMKLKKENRFKPKLLEYITQNVEGVINAFEGNGRINEVIELSKLSCTIQWARVLGFCKMLNSTKDGVSSGFSEYAIVDLVTKASAASASLLSLFNKHRQAELNTTLTELVQRWLEAKNIFDIPSPIALVHQWVDIQYEQTHGSTIYSVVKSLRTSNESGGIILEQELYEYRKNKQRNTQLCEEREMLIEKAISETNCRIYGLSRSNSLIKCGARLASCGPISCQSDSITYLDQAISVLVNLEDTCKKVTGEQVLPLLIKAYCYRALFKRIVHPSLKEFTQDIKNALKVWDQQSAYHDKIKLRDNDIDLFFHVANLLAIEGYRELNSKLYKMMIKRMKLAKNRELSDFLEMAWKSGSLNHALCASPVDVIIIEEIEDINVQSWINCGKTQEQKAGIKQCLSVIPTLSSVDLPDDDHAKEAHKTINEVKEAISTLTNEGSHNFDSFSAARLHYDLAERFIAKGSFNKALSHATQSYLVRDKHLSECFDIEWHRGQENIVGQVITKYDCPRFNMKPSSVSPFAHCCPQTYPTPWSIVRCYLESSIQTGIVQEMTGNGVEAEKFFLRGQKIAKLLHLPMFIARFSRALGKIYLKKGLWILALKSLKDAREHDCSSISCLKCILVSKAALDVQLGDYYLSRSQSTVKESDDVKSAKDFYLKARTTLDKDVWKNSKCLPKLEIMDTDDMQESPKFEMSKNPQFCCAFGISGPCESVEYFWHCGPSMCEKSLSLKSSIHMKWEFIRRRHMVRLLTRLGKCYKLREKPQKEYSYLLESLCVLLCRSTFWKQSVSTTFVEELLRKGVTAEAYGAEHALVLYKICCFTLAHKDLGEVDKLSGESVMLGLKLAFILSREFRKLQEKVSRLLTVMYAYSKDNSTPGGISMSQYASYFHQSSIGSYFNSCFLSQERNLNVVNDLREVLIPRSLTMLETSVTKFFDMLPEVSILCISILDGNSEKVLKYLLPSSQTSAWIMVSKMRLNREPILLILPISKVFEGPTFRADPSLVGDWTRYPWADNVFDKLAPCLRIILEEDSKVGGSEMKYKDKIRARSTLDQDLEHLLSDMEREWFGPWIHLLLGNWSDNQDLDAIVEEIMKCLTKEELVDERFLKEVIEGVNNTFQDDEVMAKLKLKNRFFIGTSTTDDGTSRPCLPGILKHIRAVLQNKKERICRNPVLLVLDNEIQMFPVENMPLLTKQQIFRMPSVGGIIWSIFKHQESTEDKSVVAPRDQAEIDPCICYYFIYTQTEKTRSCFEKWRHEFKFKGHCIDLSKSSDAPDTLGVDTLRELKEELKTCELFVYMGHGDGRKLIKGEEIREMDRCGAVFLLGCGSSYINYSKLRVHDGAILDYLLANSHMIVGNLWNVTIKSMNWFITEMLQAWIDTRSAQTVDCEQAAAHEKVNPTQNRNKRKAEVEASSKVCIHNNNLVSAFIKAREIVSGSSSKNFVAGVVYGVPVHITGNTQKLYLHD